MSAATTLPDEVQFAQLQWRGRSLQLEYQWVGNAASAQAPIVFLHEGLGSLAMWKEFPARLCDELGFKGLVFSRYGYGRSAPKPPGERWPVNFMHEQAHDVLPRLFETLGVRRPWLFGHSDGGSISLLHAAKFEVAGVVAVAPHIFVEDVSVTSIQKAREAYEVTDLSRRREAPMQLRTEGGSSSGLPCPIASGLRSGLKQRLARYHDDPDSAFRGWNDAWLDPAFRRWNIEAELPSITAPVLAVQGADDEYGTLDQIHGIARALPKTRLLVIPECGHSPHRDQPDVLLRHTVEFILQQPSAHSLRPR